MKGNHMSSILTNNGAMVALQTLQSINKNLGMTQSEISTGKSVASAKDNSAVWAISKQMESDVQGFKAISESLALGESTVAVARNASETVTDLLTQIKGKIVASQEQNVDRDKIQTDIVALRDQIGAVVGAAQFNGLNLVDGTSSDAMTVLSSLDRAADGSVSSSNISVSRQNLSTNDAVVDTAGTYAAGTGGSAITLNTATQTANITVGAPTAGTAYSLAIDGTGLTGFTNANATGDAAGAQDIAYVAAEGDTATDVAEGLAAAFASFAEANSLPEADLTITAAAGVLTVTTTTADNTNDIDVTLDTVTGENQAAGGLVDLKGIDVTTTDGATAALESVENLISSAIDASAAFGSAQGRIETQSDFISKLTDSLTSGIGSLVDANMEEASARLQALQVQQQLATQSLSIANQAPQSILSLFR
ncbi:MAG: flagellin [Pseudomonadota bacterium]